MRIRRLGRWVVPLWLVLCSAQVQAQQEVALPSLDGTALSACWFQPGHVRSVPADHTKTSQSESPKRPVVVALHGCCGLYATVGARKGLLNARHQAMGEMLAGEG